MKSDSRIETINPDVFLLAAERVHRRTLPFSPMSPPELGVGSSFACCAIRIAAERLDGQGQWIEDLAECSALADTFAPPGWVPGSPMWELGEAEPRILALLLLWEMHASPENRR